MSSPVERDDGLVRGDFPGGWPGDRANGFTGEGLSEAQRRMQAFVRTLFQWRKGSAAVQRGRLVHFAPDRGTYTFFRIDAASGRRVMVVLSKATGPVTLDTRRFAEVLPAGSQGRELFSGQAVDLAASLTVPPRTALVIDLGR